MFPEITLYAGDGVGAVAAGGDDLAELLLAEIADGKDTGHGGLAVLAREDISALIERDLTGRQRGGRADADGIALMDTIADARSFVIDDLPKNECAQKCPDIVHADIDPSEINKNKHADLPIVCDAKELFRAMLEKPERGRHEFWLELTDKWKAEHPFKYKSGDGKEIKGQQVVSRLAELTKGEATIVTGVGQNQMWAAQFYNYNRPRQLLTSGGLGAMGFGLPTAIGAKLAAPEETVVLIDGDGGFQMNIQELATVYALNLPLKMMILDNQILGMVSQWEDQFYNGVHADTDMKVERAKRSYPDFVQIAKGYGIAGRDVWKVDELDAALQEMLKAKEPYLLDIHTTPTESVLPMIPSGGTCENIILS